MSNIIALGFLVFILSVATSTWLVIGVWTNEHNIFYPAIVANLAIHGLTLPRMFTEMAWLVLVPTAIGFGVACLIPFLDKLWGWPFPVALITTTYIIFSIQTLCIGHILLIIHTPTTNVTVRIHLALRITVLALGTSLGSLGASSLSLASSMAMFFWFPTVVALGHKLDNNTSLDTVVEAEEGEGEPHKLYRYFRCDPPPHYTPL